MICCAIFYSRKSRRTLQQLSLRNNKIEYIPEAFLDNMTALTDLDLSWNNLNGELTSRHFADVINLDFLSLSHNKIVCLKVSAPY